MKKKKKKRIVSILLLSIMLLSLPGCTLAKEDGGAKEPDQLIGGFVTRHPIGEKIYATAEWIRTQEGLRRPLGVSFEGVEGQLFYSFEYYHEETEYSGITCLGENSQQSANIRKDENGEYIDINATLYYMPRVKEEINEFYLNPVYQTADEQIYAVQGHCISTGGGMSSQGTKLTLSHSEEQTKTLKDKRVTNRVEIDVELEAVYEPLEIHMYQMTENHEVIKEEQFIPEESFAEIRVEPETAYVHVVTEQMLPNGKTATIREIIDWEGDRMELYEGDSESEETVERRITDYYSYYSVGDGFLARDWSLFVWPEE